MSDPEYNQHFSYQVQEIIIFPKTSKSSATKQHKDSYSLDFQVLELPNPFEMLSTIGNKYSKPLDCSTMLSCLSQALASELLCPTSALSPLSLT